MILPAYSPEIEMILTVQVHCDWRKGSREGIKKVFLAGVSTPVRLCLTGFLQSSSLLHAEFLHSNPNCQPKSISS